MKRLVFLIVLAAVLAAGCTSPGQAPAPATQTLTPADSPADSFFAQAGKAFASGNFHAAGDLYFQAYDQYKGEGKADRARDAMNKGSVSVRMHAESPYNRSVMIAMIDAEFPAVPAERKAGWFPCNASQCIESDGETWFFANTINNIRSHNMDLMREATAKIGQTPFYDQMKSIALTPYDGSAGIYVNPVRWEGTETLKIPVAQLPKTGTLRLWIPLPVETPSQRNVTIVAVEPAQYVKSQTGTSADMGLAYLEIPLESVTGDSLDITARFRYTQYEVRYIIDLAKVGTYDTADPEYKKYTASGNNIVITPAMKAKALEIVGDETNPYLQAEKLYWHVVSHPYSNVPHIRLSVSGRPESVYMLETGFGDCGTQSMYFAALCRSLGIPARSIGGYQLVPGHEGTHFWSEYYLPGYGWIPNDVTIAEGAEWSYEASGDDRHQYKDFYARNLDPYRYIIQKDVDVPLTPPAGNVVMFDMVVQSPKAACDTCDTDPEFEMLDDWKVVVKKV
jgi:transglutaminase-like putative cysteine protease